VNTLDMAFERIEKTKQYQISIWREMHPYLLKNAKRAAEKLNQKEREEVPLLAAAGLVVQVSPEELQLKRNESNMRYAKRQIDHIQKVSEQARELVKTVYELIGEERFINFEFHRMKTYPEDLVYDLEFWKKIIKKEMDYGRN